MKKIISLVIVMAMVLSLGVVSYADENFSREGDISANIADKYGIVVTVDNDDVKVVTSPSKDGTITIKFYKKTGAYEIIDVEGNSTTIDKSVIEIYEKELMEEAVKSASYPDGSYQNTFFNYEYEANNFIAPWELRRPNGAFDTYYFWCYENSTTVGSLDDFADTVEVLDDVEKDFLLALGSGAIEVLYALVEAAPAGQIAQIIAVLNAGGYMAVDMVNAATDVSNAVIDCHDNYFYVYNHYAYND